MTGQIKDKSSLKIKCKVARQCPFFNKYRTKKSIAWLGIFASNCCSEQHAYCEVFMRQEKQGRFPHADTMPTGAQVSVAFQSLP